jgi:hypothetical protein
LPLPARYGFWAVSGGVAVEVVARQDTPAVRGAIEHSLAEHGVPVQALHLLEEPGHLQHPRALRCDLRETSFRPLGRSRRLGDTVDPLSVTGPGG